MATIADSGLIKLKAGSNATALTGAQYDSLIEQAESQLIADTRVNWVDAYSGLNADFQPLLDNAVSAKAAVGAVRQRIQDFPLNVATTIININLDEYDRAVSKLKDANIFEPFGGSPITK